MKLYLSVIGVAMLIISAFNIAFNVAPWIYVILATVICTALQFVLDGFWAILMNKLPDKLFGVDNKLFNVSNAERKLYEKLKVRKWKDKIWELGHLGGFSKKNLADPNSPEYIEKFIIECNKGVATHRLSYLIGFLPMLFIPNLCAYTIAVPVAIVNLFLNILPTIALRYNTPKLKLLLKRMNKNKPV